MKYLFGKYSTRTNIIPHHRTRSLNSADLKNRYIVYS